MTVTIIVREIISFYVWIARERNDERERERKVRPIVGEDRKINFFLEERKIY